MGQQKEWRGILPLAEAAKETDQGSQEGGPEEGDAGAKGVGYTAA